MTSVIIDDIIPRTQLVSAAGQTVFNTNWTVNALTDVVVYARLDGVEADDETQVVPTSDYNVTLIGGSQTVRVTFLVGRTLDEVITIVRNTPAERLNLYINTNFVPSMLNNDFGILTLVDQQSKMYDTVINPRYNVSATIEPDSMLGGGDIVLPILPPGFGWRKSLDGTKIEAIAIPDGGFAPQVGSFVTIDDERSTMPNSFPLSDLGNSSTAGMGIPAGTTAQRVIPTPPNIGLRFNTDLSIIEAYIGGNWVEIPSSAAGLFLPLAGGTMSGDIDMDGNLIHNLDAPVDPGDATNKNYVDTLIGSSAGGNTGAVQYNNAGAFGGDDNFTTDGSGNVDITGSLDVDNLSLNGNRLSASTGFVELEDSQLFNDMDADSNKVINLLDPTAPQDAATKAYVDAVAQGLYFLEPARVASTSNFVSTYNNGTSGVGATLTANSNGAASIDGVSLILNDRVLFKNQTNTFENGIYTVTQVGDGSTPAVYTRATDYDEPSDIDPGDFIVILAGTTNTGTGWVETATVTTIGTDAITFVAFTNANYVTINTNQTITGQKTFSGNVALSGGATLDLNSSVAVDEVIDDDTFATATATNIPTAESVKSYVDAQMAAGGITQVITTVFSASTTYTPTVGMKFATFYVCGGGGAGGGAASSGGTNYNVGAGGGAGYSAYGSFTAAQIAGIGGSLSLTIGARGTTPGAAPGGNGGNTLIPGFVQANGGQGGGMGATGTLGRATGGTGGVLGSGSGYSVAMLGAGGSDALFAGGIATSGAGGSCGFGLGMGGKNRCIGAGTGAAHGYDAVGYGSGGGGGCAAGTANANGGLGSQGIVIITEYIA